MKNIINLRQHKKQKARADKRQQSAEKTQQATDPHIQAIQAETKRAARQLNALKRDKAQSTDDDMIS